MPELPEVVTMVRGLRPALTGATIKSIQVLDDFLLQNCTANQIERFFSDKTVLAIHRRGKWVLIELADGPILLIEPRMTGGFWLVPPTRMNHARLVLNTDGSPSCIWFCDTRRLGRIRVYQSLAQAQQDIRRSQAEDALSITLETLMNRLRTTNRAIKPVLMDQKIVSGIGNIYADEILFEARVHPETVSSLLTTQKIEKIHAAISSVLNRAIEAEGCSFDAGYRTVLGLEGGFLAINAMYGHGGDPCPGCGHPITKTQINGLANRPTHFCPYCQKLTSKRHSVKTRKR